MSGRTGRALEVKTFFDILSKTRNIDWLFQTATGKTIAIILSFAVSWLSGLQISFAWGVFVALLFAMFAMLIVKIDNLSKRIESKLQDEANETDNIVERSAYLE